MKVILKDSGDVYWAKTFDMGNLTIFEVQDIFEEAIRTIEGRKKEQE